MARDGTGFCHRLAQATFLLLDSLTSIGTGWHNPCHRLALPVSLGSGGGAPALTALQRLATIGTTLDIAARRRPNRIEDGDAQAARPAAPPPSGALDHVAAPVDAPRSPG